MNETNQRLDIARYFLNIEVEAPWLKVANENATLFHIQSALLSFLQETKQLYSISGTAVSITDFLQEVHEKSLFSPILNELKALHDDQTSWINCLDRDFNNALSCKITPATQNNDLIFVTSTNTNQSYLAAITDLVARFREENIEY